MDKKSKNWRFKAGELCEVLGSYRYIGNSGTFSIGPPVVGHRTAVGRDLKPGHSFLVLADAQHSAWRHNRRLYVEILTDRGPAMVWTSYFKKRSDA